MREHLTREQIAALLDEPQSIAGGLAHLDECAECASEFEGMSRMRMALSGLPDLAPPDGEWDAIRARLPIPIARPWFRGVLTRPMAAAAVILLFLGGLSVGRMIAPAGDGVATEAGTALTGNRATPATLDGDADLPFGDYMRTVAELRELREQDAQVDVAEDPALAAERLTRLDALIDASREALRLAPADPAINDFLFDVVDERESLAGRLDQTLRQASMEY